MSNTPPEFSTVPDGEPSIPKAAACSSEGVVGLITGKPLEPSKFQIARADTSRSVALLTGTECYADPSLAAIQQDIEQRRERIARRLEP